MGVFALTLSLNLIFNVIGVLNCIQILMHILFVGLLAHYLHLKYKPEAQEKYIEFRMWTQVQVAICKSKYAQFRN